MTHRARALTLGTFVAAAVLAVSLWSGESASSRSQASRRASRSSFRSKSLPVTTILFDSRLEKRRIPSMIFTRAMLEYLAISSMSM